MRRREFITLLGGAAVAGWPLAARAQQPERMKRVGWLVGIRDDAEARARLAAFRDGLATRGWIEGRNIEIVARFGAADLDRNRVAVEELLRQAPDVVVTSSPASVSALMKDSRTIPIVFTLQPDPVAQGFAESLARPGGNATGFTSVDGAMTGKWLGLLKEVVPGMKRVVMLVDPEEPSAAILAQALGPAASSLGIQSTTAIVRSEAEIDQAVAAFARQPGGGLIVPPSAGLAARRALIIQLAASHRLPAIYTWRYLAAVEGGLMSYGPDLLDLFRRPASYVDRILKGADPSELPIQQPTKFELVVNLKTAKALGIMIPESFLVRADEVIE
jgi:putative tryptophan/tyrosine transport system substrate-binding protein